MKCLIKESEIRQAVTQLGAQISDDYQDRPLTVLGVLTGSIVLLSDLIRHIEIPHRVGLIQASSYRGESTSPDGLIINAKLLPDITERDVLLVDDIFDTGNTLVNLLGVIGEKTPASIKTAVLLIKEERCEVSIVPDYHCFRIPNVFVVGYGLDYNDDYRHLPHIAALETGDL